MKQEEKAVSMVLIQNGFDWKRYKSNSLTRNDKDRIYEGFKSRVMKKSNHKYFDLGEQPQLLRLRYLGSMFETDQTYLVRNKSFFIIFDNENEEAGFEVVLKLKATDQVFFLLTVYKKFFKAHTQVITKNDLDVYLAVKAAENFEKNQSQLGSLKKWPLIFFGWLF